MVDTVKPHSACTKIPNVGRLRVKDRQSLYMSFCSQRPRYLTKDVFHKGSAGSVNVPNCKICKL